MVERFRFEQNQPYPGKASVIFWTNGSGFELNTDGEPVLNGGEEGRPPIYMEAELNSPMCRLRPGESCDFETEWFPTRAGGEFHGVTEAGILIQALQAARLQAGRIKLVGSFGVFFPGRLIARLYDQHGASLGSVPVVEVNPTEPVLLKAEIPADPKTARLSIHLIDASGLDRGSLEEVPVTSTESPR
jgi:hypothetical protein